MAAHNPSKGTIPLPAGVAEQRAERFERLAEAIEQRECSECIGHDQTRPGADRHGRYALHAQGDGGRSELTRCSSPSRAEVVAESHLNEGWTIVALYDLDTLADEGPRPIEGDVVKLTEEGRGRIFAEFPDQVTGTFFVVGSETDTFDGEAYERLYLARNADADYLSGDYSYRIDEQYVTVVERAEPDKRLPVKYDVAAVVQRVVFNTVTS